MRTDPYAGDAWSAAACTLPTAEQPMRRSEFDSLFAHDVLSVEHASDRVRLILNPDPDVAGRAASLATRETGCCSFFTFELAISENELSLTVTAQPEHEPVLAALAARAASHHRVADHREA